MAVWGMSLAAARVSCIVRVAISASCACVGVTRPLLITIVHMLPATSALFAAAKVTAAEAVPDCSTAYPESNSVEPQVLVITKVESIMNDGTASLTVSPISRRTLSIKARDREVFSDVIGFPNSRRL
jgi:hypothetical protein